MDFSVITPTWNRSKLVYELLESLAVARKNYMNGEVEIIIVDSSEGEEKQAIINSCSKFKADYYEGADSVRKKRNKGIRNAKYDTIIFVDSDVTVCQDYFLQYEKAWENPYHVKLGGVLGYTEFTGPKSFWWKLIERTNLIDSFAFARKYPFHSWTIANNVSFRKSVLEEIGMFEENFPFKLGGDDLDMTYRVTKEGYTIGSAPEAVTYHSRETWNNHKAIHDRAKRWGTMENYIVQRHPELYRRVIPKDYIIKLFFLMCLGLLSALIGSVLPLIIWLGWIVLNLIFDYIRDCHGRGVCSPVVFYGARIIQMEYEFYRVTKSFANHSAKAIYKGIIYNRFQIKFGMTDESFRVKQLIWTFIATWVSTLIILRFI